MPYYKKLRINMWYKFFSMLMIGAILTLSVGQHVVQGNSVSQQSGDIATIAMQVQQIRDEGNADDLIPVIVTLKNPYGLESAIQPRSSITFRRAQIRTIQNDFVGRQGVRIVSVKRRSNVFPIVYMSMVRGNVAQLAADSQVEMVAIDRPVPPNMFASTELIGSRVANDSGYDGAGTSVAVLDTGVLATHPFLSGQVVEDACFSTTYAPYNITSFCPGGAGSSTAVGSGGPCPSGVDGCDHGTHVAGTVAGKVISVSTAYHGTQTIRGVAPGAKIIAVQVFSQFPVARCGAGATTDCALSFTSDQDAALEWLYDTVVAGAPSDWGDLASINMSLGGGEFATACDSGYSTKFYVDQLRTIGVATVIASGNDGYSDGIGGPACISSAIAVGASTSTYGLAVAADQVAEFSNSPLPANNTANGNGDRLLD
jgi:subtilisin family serine protease